MLKKAIDWFVFGDHKNKRPVIRPSTRTRVILRDGKCRYCNTPYFSLNDTGDFQIDHIWPVAYGGRNRHSFFQGNLALACQPCNGSKSDSVDPKWTPSPLKFWQYIWSFVLMIVLVDWPRLTDF